MSINWVMVHDRDGFVRLPNEHIIWKSSSSRTSLSLSTPRAYPGTNPLSIKSDNGTVYLTNYRVVYLPATPTDSFKSFSASHLNLHDTHVILPWFGPNAWQALVQPVPGGNIPNNHHVELKITFKDGGISDFHSQFEGIKERLQQAVENARERNLNAASSNAAPGQLNGGAPGLAGVDMGSVHLDQLPRYEDSGHDRIASTAATTTTAPTTTTTTTTTTAPSVSSAPPLQSVSDQTRPTASVSSEQQQQQQQQQQSIQQERQQPDAVETISSERPSEAPPGYEETQQHGLESELARRFDTGQS